jgi:hypothetical protein
MRLRATSDAPPGPMRRKPVSFIPSGTKMFLAAKASSVSPDTL